MNNNFKETIGVGAHDIKNPIATIRMGSDIIFKYSDNDVIKRQAKIISESSYDMERLVNLFSDFAYLQLEDKLDLQLSQCDDNLIDQLHKAIYRVSNLYQLNVNIEGLNLLRNLVVDKNRFLSLISSLIMAIAKSESESYEISITKLKNKKVVISLNFKSDQTIDESELFKLNILPLHKKQIVSSCLELFTAKAIAISHNGSIDFIKSNRDCIFVITLSSM